MIVVIFVNILYYCMYNNHLKLHMYILIVNLCKKLKLVNGKLLNIVNLKTR